MKGKFSVQINLLQLDETLEARKPYAIISVSTTGLDKQEPIHEPTRVVIKEYVFDDETQQYKEGFVFDKLVKCSQKALDAALSDTSYDVFENGNIDKEQYISGIGVLSKEDFKAEFDNYLESLMSNTLLIGNNTDFCKKYLNKIDCHIDRFTAIDQIALTGEYFKKVGYVSRSSTLDTLNSYMAGTDTEKLKGADKRVDVIHKFITRHGREEDILEKEIYTKTREQMADQHKDLSEKGVQKYQKADASEKFKILLDKGVISDKITDRNYDCALNRLLDAFEQKKGITAMQAATTGFTAENMPIQFTAIPFNISKGSLDHPKNEGLKIDIAANKRSIQIAVDNAKSGKFDAFAYTGIDIEKYLKGKDQKGQKIRNAEDALSDIKSYFDKYPASEYQIVTNGKAKGKDISFTQDCLTKIGNLPVFNDETYIDFTQVIKEYCYKSFLEGTDNVLLKKNDISSLKDFSLETFAKIYNYDLDSTQKKCQFTSFLIQLICEQDYQLTHQAEIEEEKKAASQDIQIAEADEKEEEPIPEPDEEVPDEAMDLPPEEERPRREFEGRLDKPPFLEQGDRREMGSPLENPFASKAPFFPDAERYSGLDEIYNDNIPLDAPPRYPTDTYSKRNREGISNRSMSRREPRPVRNDMVVRPEHRGRMLEDEIPNDTIKQLTDKIEQLEMTIKKNQESTQEKMMNLMNTMVQMMSSTSSLNNNVNMLIMSQSGIPQKIDILQQKIDILQQSMENAYEDPNQRISRNIRKEV